MLLLNFRFCACEISMGIDWCSILLHCMYVYMYRIHRMKGYRGLSIRAHISSDDDGDGDARMGLIPRDESKALFFSMCCV